MTDPELLPCPFCGSDHIGIVEIGHYIRVDCLEPDCYMYGPCATDESGAIEKWNTREDAVTTWVQAL